MEGGKGLLSIRCIEIGKQNLSLHLDQSEKSLLRLSKNVRILPEYGGPLSTAKKRKKKKKQRQKRWQEKQLYGKFARKTKEVRSEETWGWTRKGYLKKETEGLIFAAQKQPLRTNWIRKNIDDQEVSEKCRMCWERDQSITHLIAECKMLAQKEYKDMTILQEMYTWNYATRLA